MKKLICLLLVLMLTPVILLSSAFAAEDPQIVVSSVEATPGDEIKLTVALVNNPGFSNGKITVNYDEAGLEFIKIDTATLDVFNHGIMAMTNGPLMNFLAVQDVKADIELFYIYLKVKDNANGSYRVGLTINLFKNDAEENLTFKVVEGIVSVKGNGTQVPGTVPSEPNETTPSTPGTTPSTPDTTPSAPNTTPSTPGTTTPGTTNPGATVPGDTNPDNTPNTQPPVQEDPAPSGNKLILPIVAGVLVVALCVVLVLIKKRR